MSVSYEQLLNATIQNLEQLKQTGQRHVIADPELLRQLAAPRQRRRLPADPGAVAPDSRVAPQTTPRSSSPVAGSNRTASGPAPSATPAQSRDAMPAKPELSATSAPTVSREAKEAGMAQLRERALACQKCPPLVQARHHVVFGVGDISASLMFVGEAPGMDEDLQGEPFVGKAGQLLTRIIQAMGFTRETVYIANILKCRPDTPGQLTGNRKPSTEEMATCKPYVEEQIDLIQPRVIVALGATAVEGLLDLKTGITKLRGQWQTFRGVPVMPTYHPAYLLRNQSNATKRQLWEDMLQVMDRLEMEISEKQKGYFL